MHICFKAFWLCLDTGWLHILWFKSSIMCRNPIYDHVLTYIHLWLFTYRQGFCWLSWTLQLPIILHVRSLQAQMLFSLMMWAFKYSVSISRGLLCSHDNLYMHLVYPYLIWSWGSLRNATFDFDTKAMPAINQDRRTSPFVWPLVWGVWRLWTVIVQIVPQNCSFVSSVVLLAIEI